MQARNPAKKSDSVPVEKSREKSLYPSNRKRHLYFMIASVLLGLVGIDIYDVSQSGNFWRVASPFTIGNERPNANSPVKDKNGYRTHCKNG